MRWLAAALLAIAVTRAEAQAPVQRSFGVNATASLRIWLPSGRVRLETWDKDSVRVTGTTTKGSTFFGGGRGASGKVGVDRDDKLDGQLARADLVVTVPRRAQIWIKATDAVIESAHTFGDLEILTVGGRVEVSDAHAVVSIEAIDAPITVSGASGTVRLHTGGGDIVLREVTGDLTVSTVRGAVDLQGGAIGDAQIETVSGKVVIAGRLRLGAYVDIQTHDGPAELRLPVSPVPALELSSRGGAVRNLAGQGNPKFGRIVVRSFKGRVNAAAVGGVEGGKERLTP